MVIDEEIGKLGKVKFMLSSISGTSTNSGENSSTRPCISYFLVCDGNAVKTEDEIFKVFHDNQLEPEIKKVGNRQGADRLDVLKELKQVVKVRLSCTL